MEKHVLSKSTFIRGVQCLKSLYLHKKRPFLRDRLSAVQRAKFKRGSDVGLLAQKLFPGGINLQPKSPSQYRKAIAETQAAITDNNIKVIYEAGFQHDGVIVFLDVLVRDEAGWKAYEVKSSKKISETYLLDAALQYHVISNSGLSLKDISIVYIDDNYTLGDALDVSSLFRKESVKEDVEKRQEYIRQQIIKEKETIQLKHSPKIEIGPHCHRPYPCDFIGHCWKHVPTPSVFDVLGRSSELAYQLSPKGKTSLGDEGITSSFSFEQQKLAALLHKNAEQLDCEVIKSELTTGKARQYFVHILMNRPAIPFQKGYHPYQAVPAGLSVCTGEAGRSDIHTRIFRFDEKLEQAFGEFCRKTFTTSGKVYTYHENEEDVMHWLNKIGNVDQERFDLVNLRKIPEKYSFFHPEFFPDHSIEGLQKFFNRQLKKGQSESLLLMDYNAAFFNKTPDNDELLKQALEAYLVSCVEIQRIFYNFILEKCQRAQKNN